MIAWRINRGNYGDTKLDGLGLAVAVHWPEAIHKGNGTAVVFVDEKANPAQRDALLHIASGKAGGLPFEIIATTFSKVLEPQFLPFSFHFNGRNSSVKVGNVMNVVVEPIKNPVTGEPESVRLEHSTGFVFKHAECVSSATNEVNAGELKYSWPNKSAFVTQVKYGN